MKNWVKPEVKELSVLATMGGPNNGTEKKGLGNKWNGGTTEPTDPGANDSGNA